MMLRVVFPAYSRRVILFGLTAVTLASSQAVEAADPLSQADRAFLAWDVQIEIQQRDMGCLAEKRGQTAEVRALGTYLVDQHQQACMEFLHDVTGCRTLFATHFHELADAAETMKHASCMAMDASAGRYEEMFAYKVVPGRAGQSHGMTVAARAGMPTSVLARAAVLLAKHTGQHNVGPSA